MLDLKQQARLPEDLGIENVRDNYLSNLALPPVIDIAKDATNFMMIHGGESMYVCTSMYVCGFSFVASVVVVV